MKNLTVEECSNIISLLDRVEYKGLQEATVAVTLTQKLREIAKEQSEQA